MANLTWAIGAGLFCTLVATPPARVAAAEPFRSVSVEFPTSDREFPPGKGADLVAQNCTACHSPGMILTQPKLSPAAWTGEVSKMRQTYKAPVEESDVPAIVAYLATLPAGAN